MITSQAAAPLGNKAAFHAGKMLIPILGLLIIGALVAALAAVIGGVISVSIVSVIIAAYIGPMIFGV